MATPNTWQTRVITPHGPATDEETARVALLLCGQAGTVVEPVDPPKGIWLIAFPPATTKDWTYEATGGGIICPGRDTDGRLWILDVPIPR
jgi:hypothetical protein